MIEGIVVWPLIWGIAAMALVRPQWGVVLALGLLAMTYSWMAFPACGVALLFARFIPWPQPSMEYFVERAEVLNAHLRSWIGKPRPQPIEVDGMSRLEMSLALLGLTDSATRDEIRAAYRRLAKVAHPDVPGGSTASMAALTEAYDYLMQLTAPRYDSVDTDDPDLAFTLREPRMRR